MLYANPFDKLKGILPPREIKVVEESPLERLIKLNRELESEITIPDDWYEKIPEFRKELYEQINKRAGDYDSQDISALTTALSFEESKNEKTRGAYIGGLLSLLTEKNRPSKTTLEIDLDGREFPYLLLACKYVDKLKISNVKGDRVGSLIASYKGNARIISFDNVKGNDVGSWIAEYNGNAEVVSFDNIEGNDVGFGIASNGNAGVISFNNIEGDWVGSWIASNGNAGVISFNNVKGNWVGSGIAIDNGNAGVISFDNVKGNWVGSEIASYKGKYNILDRKGKYSLQIEQFIQKQRQKYQNREELNENIEEFIGSLK